MLDIDYQSPSWGELTLIRALGQWYSSLNMPRITVFKADDCYRAIYCEAGGYRVTALAAESNPTAALRELSFKLRRMSLTATQSSELYNLTGDDAFKSNGKTSNRRVTMRLKKRKRA